MRGSDRRPRWIGAIVLAVLVIGSACGSGDAPLDAAIGIAGDAGDFGTGPEAGESMARIAQHLEEASDDCGVEAEGSRCAALDVAGGYAQVLAFHVLQCTAPGRFEARTSVLELLVAIDALEAGSLDVPEPAPLPDCS